VACPLIHPLSFSFSLCISSVVISPQLETKACHLLSHCALASELMREGCKHTHSFLRGTCVCMTEAELAKLSSSQPRVGVARKPSQKKCSISVVKRLNTTQMLSLPRLMLLKVSAINTANTRLHLVQRNSRKNKRN
jgi:hypothetical protein